MIKPYFDRYLCDTSHINKRFVNMSSAIDSASKNEINYGAFSVIFLIATGFGFKISIDGIMANAFSSFAAIFSTSKMGTQSIQALNAPDITLMYLLFLGSLIGYILSIAFAGAGLATGRGNIFAGLTLGISMLPIIYVGYVIFTAALI